jgi:hypothetical protein
MKTQTRKQIISGFLLALFLAFYFNISFFSHVHIVGKERVVHSHIYNGCHDGSCDCHKDENAPGHAPNELLLIHQYSAFESLKAVSLTFASNLLPTIFDDATIFISEHLEIGVHVSYFLRGPPEA